jgi:5-methylcytosine-specific restriction endonuclease McrA
MRKSILGPKINALRLQGLSYKDIQNTLGCSLSTISYHLGKGQKEKTKKRRANVSPLTYLHVKRVNYFQNRKQKKLNPKTSFTKREMTKSISDKSSHFQRSSAFNYKDVYAKYGDHFQCGLTGRPLLWNEPHTYEYDHILPVARGGNSCIENLQIVCTDANRAKNDMTEDEFLDLCKEIVLHAGYKVYKPSGSHHSNKHL